MTHLFGLNPTDIRQLTYPQLRRYIAWADAYTKAQQGEG